MNALRRIRFTTHVTPRAQWQEGLVFESQYSGGNRVIPRTFSFLPARLLVCVKYYTVSGI